MEKTRGADATRERVLVSGASFAGLATAFWLERLGYDVTVTEIASGLRTGGTPVDLGGETIDVLVRMGLIEAVRASALPPRRLEFKDAHDRTVGGLAGETHPDDTLVESYEIHRDDLLRILSGAIGGSVDVVFGRSIAQLEQRPNGVAVTFDDGRREEYALVFGCDGNRSRTRRLAFGPDDACSFFMGGYFFIKVVPTTGMLPANVSQIYSVAGRTAFLNGYDDRTDVAFAFRSEREIAYDHRDRASLLARLHEHFDGLGWKIPAMLREMDAEGDFYFDRLNQIRLPAWSAGRVALVGDAASCVSPLAGMGGSMAIIGAARLAEALRRHGTDYAAAFRTYHDGLHGFVEEVQARALDSGMRMMFPANDAELAARDRELGERADISTP